VAGALRAAAEGPDGTAVSRGATDQAAAEAELPDLDDALDAATADAPDTAPLRALLGGSPSASA
jgi:hypothetical protein